jgi:hypothetical protein
MGRPRPGLSSVAMLWRAHPVQLYYGLPVGENRMFHHAGYSTNPSRVILSLTAGAATGAIFIALSYLWGTAQSLGIRYVLVYGLGWSIVVFMVAFVVWGIGLILFGLPLWLLFHKLRLRHWLVAAIVGAAMTFTVGFGIETRLFELIPPPTNSTYSESDSGGPTVVANRRTPHGWRVAARTALTLGAVGVVVALVIWRIAYRRSAPQAS